MLDSRGVLNTRRTGLNKYKMEFVNETEAETLEEAMKDADVFLGLSVADVLTPEMLKSMRRDPIVFAMAKEQHYLGIDLGATTVKAGVVSARKKKRRIWARNRLSGL